MILETDDRSLRIRVFNAIENAILNGEYKDGDSLNELKISKELGVSRTPVREALKMLEQEHLIEDCGKGMKVLGITLEDAIQADEVFNILMGEEVEPRRAWIEQNAQYVVNLDI